MYTLRTIDAGSAYGDFYPNAYPYGTDDDLPSANLEGIPVDTISRALSGDNAGVSVAPVASASNVNTSAPVVVNFPSTQRVTIQQNYGSLSSFLISVTDMDQIVLQKPTTERVFLRVQNRSTSANTGFLAFGNVASINNGEEILPGGSSNFDQFVPQDDVHLACDTGGTATFLVEYCNKDIKE